MHNFGINVDVELPKSSSPKTHGRLIGEKSRISPTLVFQPLWVRCVAAIYDLGGSAHPSVVARVVWPSSFTPESVVGSATQTRVRMRLMLAISKGHVRLESDGTYSLSSAGERFVLREADRINQMLASDSGVTMRRRAPFAHFRRECVTIGRFMAASGLNQRTIDRYESFESMRDSSISRYEDTCRKLSEGPKNEEPKQGDRRSGKGHRRGAARSRR